jgi:hypothetical protein
MAWPALMRDLKSEARVRALEDYKDLADDAASLKAELKVSQSVLASENSRVKRWDEMICDLKDDIVAPQTASINSVDNDIVNVTHGAGPPHTRQLPYWHEPTRGSLPGYLNRG